ncbi:hypothetical protein [Pseudonocardia asaccharolytica]|uniref:Uncharacterized protein n=1 Tax=Pseudonocardia asaccharolytica DSM 44247 = NBRC 16224 TaxID=1123024 RepID=A0A511CYN2_9PSEU|nr:hypothetical protein [Pseudonocardia asaccharolytica]GEL17662.1 hypothetical protein PA7_14990 [Pseudonocardia asaccharolytica DSM 44247 = NBRC 16224]
MSASSRHLVTTAPRRGTCPRCRRVVLEGISDGWPYHVDAIPLNLHGELHARTTGRNSYWLLAGRIYLREAHNIALDARDGRPAVVATHSCEPIQLDHIDPTYVATLAALTADEASKATEPKGQEQNSLFVLTGAFAGAQVTVVPVDDDRPPF